MTREIENLKAPILKFLNDINIVTSGEGGATVTQIASALFGAVYRKDKKLVNKALDALISTCQVKRRSIQSQLIYSKTTPLDMLAEV